MKQFLLSSLLFILYNLSFGQIRNRSVLNNSLPEQYNEKTAFNRPHLGASALSIVAGKIPLLTGNQLSPDQISKSGQLQAIMNKLIKGSTSTSNKTIGGLATITAVEQQRVTAGAQLAAVPDIIYVDSSHKDFTMQDGASWATAYGSLSEALAAAAIISNADGAAVGFLHQIWVAKGTYQAAPGQSFFITPQF